jgi:DNA-directed RNA polymerase specialized sigma24 family protein
MKRDSIDFHLVADRHLAIHARLLNWARWCNNRPGSAVAPMFRAYRSTDVWAQPTASEPVDSMDAAKIEKAVTALPEKHRAATQWHYVRGHISPVRAARALAVSLAGLAELVHDGRAMMVNRRA